MSTQQRNNVAYGLSQAILNVFPQPIVAKRDPTTNDKAQIGTLWINVTDGVAYVLTQIVNNVSTWQGLAGGNTFNTLTVTPGPTSITGTTNINTAGAGVTTIGTGGTGAVSIGNATGNTSITGSLTTSAALTVSAGGLTVTAGGLSAVGTTTINGAGAANTVIGTGGTGAVFIGNSTGNTSVTGTLTSTDDITVTAGDFIASNGNVVISTPTRGLTLPGPVNIITGAGAPANGLALHVGDIYINTTAASAATRIYVATGVGAWTNVTCAA